MDLGAAVARRPRMDLQRETRRALAHVVSEHEPRRGLREQLGTVIGIAWAPAVAAIARLRGARMFHPHGYTFAGHCEPVPGPYAALGRQLAGRVLARCSAALWRGDFEHLDVLGLALRFRRGRGSDLDERALPGDQDLLAATIRS